MRFEGALKAGTPEKRKNGLGFANYGFLDRRVVGDGDFLLRLCLRQAVVELDRFALGDLDEGLDSLLSKRHKFIGGEAAAESLGAGEANAVDFVAMPIQQMNPSKAEHAGKLVLMAALVVVIAEDRDDGNTNVFQHCEHCAHLFGHAVIGEVASDDQYVG